MYSASNLTVRPARLSDAPALERLAGLDSSAPPRGPALVAEADARILAALPLGSGRAIADPFEPTAAMVALLELRRNQLREAEAAGGGRRARRGVRGSLRRLAHARA
jgi:hypothetical protein